MLGAVLEIVDVQSGGGKPYTLRGAAAPVDKNLRIGEAICHDTARRG